MTERTTRIVLVIASVIWGLAAPASLPLVLFAPMMFDAPGSNRDPATIAFAAGVVLFPICCVISIVVSWIWFRERLRGAAWLALLPLLPMAVAALAAVAHEGLDAGFGG